jgi:very-short-patch-repair endonuclease
VVNPATKLLSMCRMSRRRGGTYNTAKQRAFRKHLRHSMTAAECVLWESLKSSQLLGKKFRRQISIGRYVVDFYCPEARLVIELDGASHFSITRDEYEVGRTRYLEEEGLKVLRFENKELYENLDGVLETIKRALQYEPSS